VTAVLVIGGAVSFATAMILTLLFSLPGSRLHVLDHPNERSLHSRPTPRTGGVAISTGILLAILFLLYFLSEPGPVAWLLGSAFVIVPISFLDDKRGLPVIVRLLGHVLGSIVVVSGAELVIAGEMLSAPIEWPLWMSTLFGVLFLTWMINLYNFMDGMDGLAGGMAVIGFGVFALFGLSADNLAFAGLSFAIAAAAGGFLVFNFPPARIFMGDTGSALLGLMAGGLSLWGAKDGVFPFWAGLLIFSPFIVDATVTLLRRLFRGERVWQAHRTHYYQRLVRAGWGHRRTALLEYVLMAACASAALAGRDASASVQGALIAVVVVLYVVFFAVIRAAEVRAKGAAKSRD